MNTELFVKDLKVFEFFIVLLLSFVILIGVFYVALDFLLPQVSPIADDSYFFAQVNARHQIVFLGSIFLPVIVIVLFQRYFLSETTQLDKKVKQ